VPLFRRKSADEKAEKKARKKAATAELQAMLDDRRGRREQRREQRRESKESDRREKVMTALAPYVFDGEEVMYLVKFKQGEEIFTDYLAVTDTKLLLVTGLLATTPSVEVVPFRALTGASGREGHLTFGINGKARNLHHIEPKEQAPRIVEHVSTRL
jgi:hypothetical protein